jgi:hypothetical protein
MLSVSFGRRGACSRAPALDHRKTISTMKMATESLSLRIFRDGSNDFVE